MDGLLAIVTHSFFKDNKCVPVNTCQCAVRVFSEGTLLKDDGRRLISPNHAKDFNESSARQSSTQRLYDNEINDQRKGQIIVVF